MFYFIYIYFKKYLLIHLTASCNTQDPCWITWDLSLLRLDSPVMTCMLSRCSAQTQLLHGMQDLSSLTGDQTHIPCTARKILTHWTTVEVPGCFKKRIKEGEGRE